MLDVSLAVAADQGCAIRVRTDGGSVLFDTGLPGAAIDGSRDEAVFLSHVHRDHSGNLDAPGLADKPLITSVGTANSLVMSGIVEEEGLLSRVTTLREERDLPIGPALSARGFPVPHCPGSVGFMLRSPTSTLFYTGDVCLATSRHDFLPALVARVEADPAPRKTVVLDATMAGRAAGASGSAAASQVLERLGSVSDFVLCSRDVSQLLYAHLDLFATAKSDPTARGSASTIMTPRARPLMQLLHAAFIDREIESLDQFLVAQYGRAMSAWAESRWLYWLDELPVPPDGPRIWLVHPDDLKSVTRTDAELAWIGRDSEGLDSPLPSAQIDTKPWTQHSDALTLVRAVEELSVHASVVLFHNYARRLDKFIAKHELHRCTSLSGVPQRL